MTIIVLVSVTCYVVIAGIYNSSFSHYPFCILFAFSKYIISLWFFTWWGDQ